MKSADDFALIPYGQDEGFPGAISKERSAAALRSLANAVEAGTVQLQTVELKSAATSNDFAAKTLTLVYSEIATRSEDSGS